MRYCVHHPCVYYDSRSECYQIEDFDGEGLGIANAIDLLRKELASKPVKAVIGLDCSHTGFVLDEACQ